MTHESNIAPEAGGSVTERPIIMTPESVRSILNSSKTQTRRIVDMRSLFVDVPSAVSSDLPSSMPPRVLKRGGHRAIIGAAGAVFAAKGELFGLKPGEFHFRCPYADGVTHLGDYGCGVKQWTVAPTGEQRLWVKETWQAWHRCSVEYDEWEAVTTERRHGLSWSEYVGQYGKPDSIEYAANGKSTGPWTSSMFMPRWASRLTLEVTHVRVQRLQDITELDARAEGVDDRLYPTACDAYSVLWDRINRNRATWASNPWVWAITFRRTT